MKRIIEAMGRRPEISDWKINVHRRESSELFFVKGQLDTVRRTDNTSKRATVYVDHDGFRGDAQFYVYPSTTDAELEKLSADAVKRALFISNAPYSLPEKDEGDYVIESNFASYDSLELGKEIAAAALAAGEMENGAINSLEVFVTKHFEETVNSRGLCKTQTRYDAMVEAIPTYNGDRESVELYEQYNFSSFDPAALKEEIAEKMAEVKARYEASAPGGELSCPVIMGKLELSQLFHEMASDLDYAAVYSQSNLHKKGEAIQPEGSGDRIGITMLGSLPGSVRSSRFDIDGLSLDSLPVVEKGIVTNYHGSNRFGQYIGEKPSGIFPCIKVDAGSLGEEVFSSGPSLEIISMSGLQVDFYSDYIGGEVRLAYYNNGEKTIPLTGLSVSGKLSEVLAEIALSAETAVSGSYCGPKKALIKNMKIF